MSSVNLASPELKMIRRRNSSACDARKESPRSRSSSQLSVVSKMLDVESSPCGLPSPQAISQPLPIVFHRRSRLSSVPLIELSRQLSEEEVASVNRRRSLTNSLVGELYGAKGGMCSVSDTMESLHHRGGPNSPIALQPGNVRIKHLTRAQQQEGSSRFPKLDECAHFHYEHVELGPVKVCLSDEKHEGGGKGSSAYLVPANGADKENDAGPSWWFCVQITSNGRGWSVRRSYEDFRSLDRQLHRCVYDRKYSLLSELLAVDSLPEEEDQREEALRGMLTEYLERFSHLAGSLISCGTVLNWLELDNRGNRLIVTDEAAINTPAVAAAYVVKRYRAQASDEISFEVGDMVSVIDMPPQDESTWWRGKKGFEVGFFPCECVEIIGDKVPQSLKVPKSSPSSTSSSSSTSKPVLRKHGKLIAFFRSFLVTRPSRRKLKQSGILKERVFGCDLGELMQNTGRDIPLVLKCCTEFIEAHGIVDGIYRLSGVTSNIQKLRLAFDEDRSPDLTDEAILQDIHCVASLLKMYFRELPNPLLTYQLYDKFVTAVQSEDEVRLLRLRDVVQQLPPPHYRTLEYLMRHLARVAAHGQQTGMTPKNVAIVWAPNLLRSKDLEGGGVGALHVVGVQAVLTEYLIRYADLLFNEKMPVFPSPNFGLDTPRRTRPKSLAISTPTKLLTLEEARSRVLTSNLPPSHQKYIDVGGGPDKLPPKYHTVIDLPIGKRGSSKLKKSPSGWKSFFSRTGSREKERIGSGRKISSPRKISTGSMQYPMNPLQDKMIAEFETAHAYAKKLRTVKSAESLVLSSGGGPSCRNSGSLDLSSPADFGKLSWSAYQYSTCEPLSNSYQSPVAKSPTIHKHVRSVSHDSYFEQLEGGCEDEEQEHMEEEEEDEDDVHSRHVFDLYREVEQMIYKSDEMKFGNLSHCLCDEESQSNASEESKDGAGSLIDPVKSTRKQKLHSSDSDVGSPKVQRLSKKFRQGSESSAEKVENEPEYRHMVEKSIYMQAVEDGTFEPMDEKREMISRTISFDNDGNQRVVTVERYGNEETVIVEVHATQEIAANDERLKQTSDMSSEIQSIDDKSPLVTDMKRNQSSDEFEAMNSNCCSLAVTTSDTQSTSQLRSFEPGEQCVLSENYFADDRNYLSPTGMDTSLETPDSPTMANISEMPSSSSGSGSACSSDLEGYEHRTPEDLKSPSTLGSSQSNKTSPCQEHDELTNQQMNCQRSPAADFVSHAHLDILKPGRMASVSSCDSELQENHFECEPFDADLRIGDVSETESLLDKSLDISTVPKCVSEDIAVSIASVDVAEEISLKNNDLQRYSSGDSLRSSWRKSCLDRSPAASPVDETRRKFESEIGRTIVRDHQMRLEMEQIQAEGQQKAQNRLSFSEKQPDYNELTQPKPKANFMNGVELRRSPARSTVDSTNSEVEKKRNSEPFKGAIKEATLLVDSKRMSEPLGVCPIPKYLLNEKKSVKELLSKFEVTGEKVEEETSNMAQTSAIGSIPAERQIRQQVTLEDNETKQLKPSQPSLFTQLKVLKLQSLHSPPQGDIPKTDPWSDPILDLMEQSDPYQRVLVPDAISEVPSLQTKSSKKSPVRQTVSVPCCTAKSERPQTLNLAKPPKSIRSNEAKKSSTPISAPVTPLNEESGDVKCNITPLSSPTEETLSQSSSTEETEAIRRERIERYKEERRAQMREKLRSESFRMEAEEKEKVQNEFRLRKGSGAKTAGSPEEPSRPRSLSPKKGIKCNVEPFTERSKSSEESVETKNLGKMTKSPKTPVEDNSNSKWKTNGENKSIKSPKSPTNNGASIYNDRSRNSTSKKTPIKQQVTKGMISPVRKVEIVSLPKVDNGRSNLESSPVKSDKPSSNSPPKRIRERAAMFECQNTTTSPRTSQTARQ